MKSMYICFKPLMSNVKQFFCHQEEVQPEVSFKPLMSNVKQINGDDVVLEGLDGIVSNL